MNARLLPGIFWPYGDFDTKVRMSTLLWNIKCEYLLTAELADDGSIYDQSEIECELARARRYIVKQTDELISLLA